MKKREPQLEESKTRYDLLIRAVHEMNDLIHELREENQQLKDILEEVQDE